MTTSLRSCLGGFFGGFFLPVDVPVFSQGAREIEEDDVLRGYPGNIGDFAHSEFPGLVEIVLKVVLAQDDPPGLLVLLLTNLVLLLTNSARPFGHF